MIDGPAPVPAHTAVSGTGPSPSAGPGVRIGPLRPGDAGEVLTVQRAAYVTEAQRYGAPDIPPLRETLAELRADLEAGVLALGAWSGARLVGSVRGRVAGSEMEVVRFTVAPDVQGRGVGRALLAAVHAAAPPAVTRFWLVTGARSDDNLRLYAAAGYRIAGAVTDSAGVELARLERPAR
ncbi:GNAT family N-acetyltransferase [Pseudonocardia acidicola]|uniref:GNAT family N-acetyltransferase n=1 Tax=Pseudonocardia acidicola TaxID=2724939 RepID=A0ABX1SL12_9PSEU|nr:GNAT family N-acetyltransferase [Pseudonocardia acidicola]NMI01233.1 GNAT family N-acetyltransferase [Pseudonocardia acidicola]